MFTQAKAKLLKAYEAVKRQPQYDLTTLEINRQAFLGQYGWEKLQGLQGQDLMEFWHGRQNGEGLLYELEFGSRLGHFGSLAGGSALKYKVYRGADGDWKTKGSGNIPVVITEEEAIRITEKLARDLVQGCQWAIRYELETGSAEGWNQFIEKVGVMPPPIKDEGTNQPTLFLGWAHKYLAVNLPDIFSFHHQHKQLAAHLILLGVDISEKPSRYSLDFEWQKLRLNDPELAACNPLFLMSAAYDDECFGYGPNYWRIGAFDIPIYDDRNFVSSRVDSRGKLGDLKDQLSGLSGKAAVQRLKDLVVSQDLEDAPVRISLAANDLARFFEGIKKGDRVVPMAGQCILGIGIITSDYKYDGESSRHHFYDVDWYWKEDRAKNNSERVIIKNFNYQVFNFRDKWKTSFHIESLLNSNTESTSTTIEPPPPKAIPLDAQCEHLRSVLERKSQIILHGPPGTGKTYLARRAARELITREIFEGLDWANLNKEQAKQVDERITFCTFHPAYTYEEFIEGFRPVAAEQGATFERKDGVFLEACERAEARTGHSVLIIDEINRANVSAVLGELMSLLEHDKRGDLSATLPLSRREFKVPENLWIIGTMNTSDRSIALLDAALRRRFGFLELMPEPERLDARVESIHLGKLLGELNKRVRQHVPRNARALQVGHSYFLHEGKPLANKQALLEVLRDDVFPLLAEYCYDDYAVLSEILGEAIIDRENACFHLDVMGNASTLISALAQGLPEIIVDTEEDVDEGNEADGPEAAALAEDEDE